MYVEKRRDTAVAAIVFDQVFEMRCKYNIILYLYRYTQCALGERYLLMRRRRVYRINYHNHVVYNAGVYSFIPHTYLLWPRTVVYIKGHWCQTAWLLAAYYYDELGAGKETMKSNTHWACSSFLQVNRAISYEYIWHDILLFCDWNWFHDEVKRIFPSYRKIIIMYIAVIKVFHVWVHRYIPLYTIIIRLTSFQKKMRFSRPSILYYLYYKPIIRQRA